MEIDARGFLSSWPSMARNSSLARLDSFASMSEARMLAVRRCVKERSSVPASTNSVIMVSEPASQFLFATAEALLIALGGNCAASIPA